MHYTTRILYIITLRSWFNILIARIVQRVVVCKVSTCKGLRALVIEYSFTHLENIIYTVYTLGVLRARKVYHLKFDDIHYSYSSTSCSYRRGALSFAISCNAPAHRHKKMIIQSIKKEFDLYGLQVLCVLFKISMKILGSAPFLLRL